MGNNDVAIRLWLLISFLMLPFVGSAQVIRITKFERDYTGLEPRMNPVYDQNGEACALVTFWVPDTDFVIEGSMGTVKQKSEFDRIILWIPKGTKRFTIRHKGCVPLKGFRVPIEIEEKAAYDVFVELNEEETTKAKQTVQTPAKSDYQTMDGFWFTDILAGVQYTLGDAKFNRLIRQNVQLGVGRQVNSWLAVRLQANGWESRGGWNMDGFTKAYSINYVAPGLDAMVNLSTLVAGYNPNRAFYLFAFLGAGANIAFNNDDVNKIANGMTVQEKALYDLEYLWDGSKVSPFGRAGLEASLKLSNSMSLLIEGNANLLTDEYNSKKKESPDWYFNVLVGLRISLGSK